MGAGSFRMLGIKGCRALQGESGRGHGTMDFAELMRMKPCTIPARILPCLSCDQNGIVCCGFPDGLIRFDGKGRKLYDRNNASLPSNRIHWSSIDSAGRIWFRNSAGITRSILEKQRRFISKDKAGFQEGQGTACSLEDCDSIEVGTVR